MLQYRVVIPRRLVIAAASLCFAWMVWAGGCFDSRRKQVNDWLEYHRLATLPPTVTLFDFYERRGFRSGEFYIRIRMQPEELNAFLTNSVWLNSAKLEVFSPTNRSLPFPPIGTEWDPEASYFDLHAKAPPWFDLVITNKGRRYDLFHGQRAQLFINEETSTAYLRSTSGI